MKLAEALAERSDCQVRIEEMKKRLIRSARVQEGDQPAEDTTELLAETERTFARMLELVSAINRTNSKTEFDSERAISNAIAERDVVLNVATSLPESQRLRVLVRIGTQSRKRGLLRPYLSENCRRKWISSRRDIANLTLGCRN
jgi:hypothetical protein